jgi:gamma-glutamylcyclotransferase (GGCT)/AIG2-like uncharacterized protein YtfP
MMKDELVFAYGSNMDLAQMQERCPHSVLAPFVAEGRGWKLCFPRESIKRKGGVGSVVREEGSSVWGVVFCVSDRDLLRLDRFEGVAVNAYRRGMIELRKRDGQPVNAWTYFAIPEGAGKFIPHRDYIDLYMRGAEHFELPEEYIGILKEIRAGAKQG